MFRPIDRSVLNTWRERYQSCPHATFFHSPAWYLTQHQAGGGTIHAFCHSFANLDVLVPCIYLPRFRGLGHIWSFGVGSGYGGVLAERPLWPDEMAHLLTLIRNHCANLIWTSNPFEHPTALPWPASPHAHQTTDHTQVLGICDPTSQLKQMTAARARQVRRSCEGELTTAVIDAPSPDLLSQILPIYQSHAAQWTFKRWVRDRTYFETLLAHGGDALTLFVVNRGADAIGFQLIARKGSLITQLHLATDRHAHSLYPGAHLMHAVLDWARHNQITEMDLLSSGELDGVRHYKATYGAQPKPFGTLTTQNWRSRALTWSAQLARKLTRPDATLTPQT